ncbi:MAG: hypothetical protein BWY23_01532 [Spirochaetes bacterium ADurb.Bin218]|nr:MAG: hypothetical protein BWY23_01532 [Spirochaetes bacterium ADurb.Bin218]
MILNLKRYSISQLIYVLFIFFLPFTALGYFFDYFKAWCQNASLIFLLIGTIISIILYINKNTKIKIDSIILILLIYCTYIYLSGIILSSYFYFTKIIPDTIVIKESILKAWTIGLIFLSFIYTYTYNNQRDDLQLSIRTIYFSLLFVIIYGYIQILVLLFPNEALISFYMTIQKYINFSWIEMFKNSNLQPQVLLWKRIMLTNQEPSIAAYMLQTLFYPFLFSSALSNFTVFEHFKIKAEYLLLLLSLPLIIFTFSTAGFIVLLMQIIIFLYLVFKYKKIQIYTKYNKFLIISIPLIIILLLYCIAKNDEFLNLLKESIIKLFMDGSYQGSAQTRFSLLVAGLKQFFYSPIFGVGFGNAKYFLDNYIPHWGQNAEIAYFVTTKMALTAKALFIRILIETGIMGIIPLIIFIAKTTRSFIKIDIQNTDTHSMLKFFKYSYIFFFPAFILHSFNHGAFFIIFQWALIGLYFSVLKIKNNNI